MGMNQDTPKQKVGDAFFSTFALAVSSKIDFFKSIWINETKISDIPNNVRDFRVMTGIKSDQYPSSNGKSLIQLFNGINNSINPKLTSLTGIISKYKNIAYVFFDNAFIGDNVGSYPNYGFEVQRTHIMGWSYNYSVPNEYELKTELLDEIITEDGTKQANPAVILYYILNQMAEINENLISKEHFYKAAIQLREEKFGIAMTITSSNNVKEWISEILRHIDGSFYFDSKIGKYVLKLLRNDYVVNDLFSISENDIKDLKYNKRSWDDISTNVVLNYTSSVNYKKTTIYAENRSVKIIRDSNKTTEVTMMCIQDDTLASSILNREFKKYGTPLATLKFKVPNNIVLNIFDVVKFNSAKLGIKDMIIRISEVGSDSFDQNYYDVTAIEDIYSSNDYEIVKFENSLSKPLDYTISKDATIVNNILVLNKDLSGIDSYPCLLINDNISSDDLVVNDIITYKDNKFTQTLENFTELYQEINTNTLSVLDEIILKRKDYMKEIFLANAEWQSYSNNIVINNEIMSFKTLEFINNDLVKLTKVLRNVNYVNLTKHEVNDIVFFVSNFDIFALTSYNDNDQYTKLDIRLTNKVNETDTLTKYVDNFINYYKPYKISMPLLSEDGLTLTFISSNINKTTYTASYNTIDVIESNVSNLTENFVDTNQQFLIEVNYKDLTKESIYTNNTTYTFNKKVINGYIYNIINNIKSDKVSF